MFFNSKSKVQIVENKGANGGKIPRFHVSYGAFSESEKTYTEKALVLLDALIGNQDLLIEVKTNYFNLHESKREDVMLAFIKSIRLMNLKYRFRKQGESEAKSIFGAMIGKKQGESQEFLVSVSNQCWKTEAFRKILPMYGVKFFVCSSLVKEKNMDEDQLLDNTFNGQFLDEDFDEMFPIILFDCNNIGQMGVFTKKLSLKELKQMLPVANAD